jgi:FAD/FMN-containing dehydrogenase
MNLEMIIPTLRSVFSGDIETHQDVLEKYSRDASMFKIMPQVVVFPKHSADIQALGQVGEKTKRRITIGSTAYLLQCVLLEPVCQVGQSTILLLLM